VYGGYKIWDKITAIVRYDRLMIRSADQKLDQNYFIAGIDYEPVRFFNTSLNFRYFSEDNLPFIFASFGLRF
jgi:hypothetical protein